MVRSARVLIAVLLFSPVAAKADSLAEALEILAVHRVAEAQPHIDAALADANADALRRLGDALSAAGAYDRAAAVYDREIALRTGGPRPPLALALARRAQATVGGLRYGDFRWHRSDPENARIDEGVRFANRALAALAEAVDPPYAAHFETLSAAHHLYALAPEWEKGRETARRLLALIMSRMDFEQDELLTERDGLLVPDLLLLNSAQPFAALHHRTFGNPDLFALRRIADAYTALNPRYRFQDVEYFFDVALFETGAGGLRAAEMAMMAGDRYREINTDDRRRRRPASHAVEAAAAYRCAAGFYDGLYGPGTQSGGAWLRVAAAAAQGPPRMAPQAVHAGARGAAHEADAATVRRRAPDWPDVRESGVQGLFAALTAADLDDTVRARVALLGFQALLSPRTDPLTPLPDALGEADRALAIARGAALDRMIRAEAALTETLGGHTRNAPPAVAARAAFEAAVADLRAFNAEWARDPARNGRHPLAQPGLEALQAALGPDEGLLIAGFVTRPFDTDAQTVDVSALTLTAAEGSFSRLLDQARTMIAPWPRWESDGFAEALAAVLDRARAASPVTHWHVVAAPPLDPGDPARLATIHAAVAAAGVTPHADLAEFIAAQGGSATPDANREDFLETLADAVAYNAAEPPPPPRRGRSSGRTEPPPPVAARPPVGCRTEPL